MERISFLSNKFMRQVITSVTQKLPKIYMGMINYIPKANGIVKSVSKFKLLKILVVSFAKYKNIAYEKIATTNKVNLKVVKVVTQQCKIFKDFLENITTTSNVIRLLSVKLELYKKLSNIFKEDISIKNTININNIFLGFVDPNKRAILDSVNSNSACKLIGITLGNKQSLGV